MSAEAAHPISPNQPPVEVTPTEIPAGNIDPRLTTDIPFAVTPHNTYRRAARSLMSTALALTLAAGVETVAADPASASLRSIWNR
jgi:hypothetical protein